MLVENSYPQDTRVRNEASLLASAGYEVRVICLRKPGQARVETIGNVRVYRLPRLELFKKTPAPNPGLVQALLLRIKSFFGYLVEYAYFTTACFLTAACILIRHGFDVIHAHNPPDTLFLAALPFKLLGKKFVFDHHDLCPELYLHGIGPDRACSQSCWESLNGAASSLRTSPSRPTNPTNKSRSFAEKGARDYLHRPKRTRQAPHGPGRASLRLASKNKCILAYIGSLNPQDGVDYLLRSLHQLLYTQKRDDFYCVVMGSGDSLEDLRLLARELRLDQHVELPGFVSEEDLQANLAAADICLDPDPSSP